jgi:signal peptide peptidase SppA
MSILDRLFFFRPRPPTVAVLRLTGIIGQLGPLRAGMTLASQAPHIERAFNLRGLKAVALAVNSPGGSPVQSALIFARIRQLAAEKHVPVIAFAEDVAASGGYWLACAGDEIYAQEASVLGSIGVISASFGFHEAIRRLGVERRVYTAGVKKGLLDPFLPENPEDVARLKELQADVHAGFKSIVRERRAGRLKVPEDELFSGAFWSGRKCLEFGLVDGIADLRGEMRRRYGDKVRLQLVGPARNWLQRRFAPSSQTGPLSLPTEHAGSVGLPADMGALGSGLGSGLAEGLLSALEERALWGRYGL